jgi:hypothetical protein
VRVVDRLVGQLNRRNSFRCHQATRSDYPGCDEFAILAGLPMTFTIDIGAHISARIVFVNSIR